MFSQFLGADDCFCAIPEDPELPVILGQNSGETQNRADVRFGGAAYETRALNFPRHTLLAGEAELFATVIEGQPAEDFVLVPTDPAHNAVFGRCEADLRRHGERGGDVAAAALHRSRRRHRRGEEQGSQARPGSLGMIVMPMPGSCTPQLPGGAPGDPCLHCRLSMTHRHTDESPKP